MTMTTVMTKEEKAFTNHIKAFSRKITKMRKVIEKQYRIHHKGINRYRINETIKVNMLLSMEVFKSIEEELREVKLPKTATEEIQDLVFGTDEEISLEQEQELEQKRQFQQKQEIIQRILVPLETVGVPKTEDVEQDVSRNISNENKQGVTLKRNRFIKKVKKLI